MSPTTYKISNRWRVHGIVVAASVLCLVLLFPRATLIPNIDSCLDGGGQWDRPSASCVGVDSTYVPLSERWWPNLWISLALLAVGGALGFASSKMDALLLGRRSAVGETVAAAIRSGAGAGMVYGIAELSSSLFGAEPLESWYWLVIAYVFAGATSFALLSVLIRAIAESTAGVRFPLAARWIWGGLIGIAVCLFVDSPTHDFSRWLPYPIAATAGVVAAMAFNWNIDRCQLGSA